MIHPDPASGDLTARERLAYRRSTGLSLRALCPAPPARGDEPLEATDSETIWMVRDLSPALWP